MPILVRPVREQLEHDRVIRHLQAKFKRKYDVIINVGEEKNAAVKAGPLMIYPDVVLNSVDRGRKLSGVIEVETTESVNNLEAMAQWVHLGRARVPFHLYVPAAAVDMARRLCTDNAVVVSEIWSYHAIGDQMRFTMVHRAPAPAAPRRAAPRPAPTPTPAPRRKAAPSRQPRASAAKARAKVKRKR